jgi:hypothetical protein
LALEGCVDAHLDLSSPYCFPIYSSLDMAIHYFGCSSEQNLSDGSTNNKDYRKCNVYKFKHNITKRFSEEGKPFLLKSDTSSNDSREEDVEHSKQKVFSYREH